MFYKYGIMLDKGILFLSVLTVLFRMLRFNVIQIIPIGLGYGIYEWFINYFYLICSMYCYFYIFVALIIT